MDSSCWPSIACSLAVAVHRSVYKDGAAADCAEGDRSRGEQAVEGRVAGILRREAGAVHRQAGEEVPDVVDRRVFGRQDDAGRPFAPGHDLSGGGQGHEASHKEVSFVDHLKTAAWKEFVPRHQFFDSNSFFFIPQQQDILHVSVALYV